MTSTCSASTNQRGVCVTLHFISFALLCAPIHITLYFGNLVVYLNSYWYATQNPTRFDSQWVVSAFLTSWSTTLIAADMMIGRLDHRTIMFMGILCFDTGMFCSYFSVQHSQIAFISTFGVLSGIGIGIIQVDIYARVPTLVTKRLALAFASLNNFFVVGAILYQSILTWYINSDNKEADKLVFGHFIVFSEKSIVDRVPSVFLLLGIVTSAFHSTGFLLSVILLGRDKERLMEDSNLDTKRSESTSFRQHVRYIDGNLENQKLEANNSMSSPERETSQILYSNGNESRNYVQPVNQPSSSHENQKLSRKESSIEQPNLLQNRDLNVIQMLKTVAFYVLWFTFVANESSYVALLSFYKTFGELYIHDDHFLTFMGISLLCVVFFMRIVWAMLIDMFGIKTSQVIFNSLMSLGFLFYFFTPKVNRWFFALWTNAISALCAGMHVNIPVMTLKLFGKTNFTSNYAIVATSTIFINIALPTVFQAQIKNFGWSALFISNGAVTLVALIAISIGIPNKK